MTFCVFPWMHMATFTNGDVIPCCVANPSKNPHNLNNEDIKDIWNSEYMKDIRLKMLNGEKVDACTRCYKEEEFGVKSHRVLSNEIYQKKFDIQSLIDNTDETGYLKELPKTLDLRLGNVCNLKCVMCRPQESYKWYNDIKQLSTHQITSKAVSDDLNGKIHYDKSVFEWAKDDTLFWTQVYELLPTLRELILAGGEPFLLDPVKSFLSYAVETGHSKHLKIRFHTNGTMITDDMWRIFEEFEEIELMVSIDAVDKKNELLRYPANWDDIVENLNHADKLGPNIKVFFLTSLNVMSFYYLDELIKWKYEQNWTKINNHSIILGRVMWPEYLNPQLLPIEMKKTIKAKINDTLNGLDINHIDDLKSKCDTNIEWLFGECNTTISDFTEYMEKLDLVRGTDAKSVFTEFYEELKNV